MCPKGLVMRRKAIFSNQVQNVEFSQLQQEPVQCYRN